MSLVKVVVVSEEGVPKVCIGCNTRVWWSSAAEVALTVTKQGKKWVKNVKVGMRIGRSRRTNMNRGRLTPRLLLRLGILLTAVCLCIYVYLETGWKASLASSDLGTQFVQNWGQLKINLASAEVEEREESWEISYIHIEDSEPTLHKKVRLKYVFL